MIALLTIVFIAIAFLEIPTLVKKKYWHELWVFLFFLTAAAAISASMALGINLPSPVGGIEYFVKEVLHLSYK